VSAPAPAAFGLVTRHFVGEFGGVAAVLAAIRMARFDLAGALFVPAFFLDVIDFHGMSSFMAGWYPPYRYNHRRVDTRPTKPGISSHPHA
jgi:hypothetical protein